MSFLELLEKLRRERRRYLDDLPRFLEAIKEAARSRDPEARVILFGSFVEGRHRPDSDIDVLIVTRLAADEGERLSLRRRINDALGRPNPFELHIVTPEQYSGWYSRFLKKQIEI